MSYRDLEIWKLAKQAAIGVHRILDLLGRKLNVFIEAMEREHISHPASRISDPASHSR